MVWAAVAIGAASVGASVYGSIQASNASDRASQQQAQANQSNLAFQQQQYQDWQSVYGPIRQNLSNFYQGLTPETFAASGLKQYDLQYQAIEQNLQRSFAQHGVDSGAQDFLNQNAALTGAEAKANIRQQAPLQLANAKQSFLTHQVSNPDATGVSNAYGNQATQFGNQATQLGNQAATGYQAAGTALNGAVKAYLNRPAATPPDPSPVTQPLVPLTSTAIVV